VEMAQLMRKLSKNLPHRAGTPPAASSAPGRGAAKARTRRR
jgi:hypothetical protein